MRRRDGGRLQHKFLWQRFCRFARKVWGKNGRDPIPAEKNADCRNQQRKAPNQSGIRSDRRVYLRNMNFGFLEFFRGSGDFRLITLHYFRRIEIQTLAICPQKSPVIYTARQVTVPALLEAFEIMKADARVCRNLPERNVSFFALCFKIRCKRSHGKIRVVQECYEFNPYRCASLEGCILLGFMLFVNYLQILTVY